MKMSKKEQAEFKAFKAWKAQQQKPSFVDTFKADMKSKGHKLLSTTDGFYTKKNGEKTPVKTLNYELKHGFTKQYQHTAQRLWAVKN